MFLIGKMWFFAYAIVSHSLTLFHWLFKSVYVPIKYLSRFMSTQGGYLLRSRGSHALAEKDEVGAGEERSSCSTGHKKHVSGQLFPNHQAGGLGCLCLWRSRHWFEPTVVSLPEVQGTEDYISTRNFSPVISSCCGRHDLQSPYKL